MKRRMEGRGGFFWEARHGQIYPELARLEVAKHPGAKKGFVLLPRRWAVERSFAWAARFRR